MRRYGHITAVLYDRFSGERPFYRRGRLAAVSALGLRRGDRVLVLGCGTGLDLPLLASAVGDTGTIIAVDDSAAMLQASGRRARDLAGRPRRGWPRVRLVLADLTRARSLLPPDEAPVDAVLAINTLCLIPDWRAAWSAGLRAARPGARLAIADIGRPDPHHPVIALWSRWIAFVGSGDLGAHPWVVLEQQADEVRRSSFWGGHVQVRSTRLT